jgi:hypothetical protein
MTHNYVTRRDVLGFIETNYGKWLTCQLLGFFLKTHGDLRCQCGVRGKENLRVEVPYEY